MSHFVLFHWIMIQIFIAHTASQTVIRGVIGQPVQLPCFYQVTRHKDISDMCWGRGPCPNSKCNNKILHTTGNRVTFRKSQRYSLQGYISYGDVSLTIGKVKAEDAGTYCCRIEIPGWFNDIKKNMQLEVVRARPVMTTTTRKAPVSPKSFRKTTFAPQSTSDYHTTAETTVLLTTTIPKATSATTDHQTMAETAVLLTTAIPEATSATTDHQTMAETAVLLTTAVPEATSATTDHQATAETAVLLTTAVPEATSATTDHQATAETAVLLTTAVPEATSATTDHQATAETAVLLTTAVPEATSATTDHQGTAETAVLLTTAIPEATSATTNHQGTAETAVLLTTAIPEATSATTDHQATAETAVLLTTAVPEATSATTDHQATAETAVLLTTAIPEATSATTDHQGTAETAVLLMTAVPKATSATIESPAVITVDTIALPTFAVTANDTFPATIVTTSALPDFPTGFQTTDMRTEDDHMFCSAESVPLPGVTTEFPSALLTAEGIKSAHPSLVVGDVPTVGFSSNSDVKDEKHNDNRDKFPSYAILIACVIVVSILFILMFSSLFWKRRHTKKFIIKSLGPVEDIEKVFSDTEGENSIFSL